MVLKSEFRYRNLGMDKLLDENVQRPIGEVLKPYEKTIRNTIIYGGLGVVSIPIAATIFAYKSNQKLFQSKKYISY